MMDRIRRKMHSGDSGGTPVERAKAEGAAEASVQEKLGSDEHTVHAEGELAEENARQEREDRVARESAVDNAAEIASSLEDSPKFGAAMHALERVRRLVSEGGDDQDAITRTYNDARNKFNELDVPGLSDEDEATLYGAMDELDQALGQGHLREVVMKKAA